MKILKFKLVGTPKGFIITENDIVLVPPHQFENSAIDEFSYFERLNHINHFMTRVIPECDLVSIIQDLKLRYQSEYALKDD